MRLPLRLLFGIGYPRSGIRAAAAVQRDGEGTEFCDVIVAAFGRLMTQGHIGLTPRGVRRRH